MKPHKRRIVIFSVVAMALLVMAGTAAAVFAIVSNSDPLEAFLGRRPETAALALAQDPIESETDSIYDRGVLVQRVDPDSPAATAGIRRGTIILSVDGRETNTIQELNNVLAEKGSGATVTLSVLNSAVPEDLSVTLAEAAPFLGVRLVGDAHMGQLGSRGDGNCVCGFDFQTPEGLEEFGGLPDKFGIEPGARLSGVYVKEVVEDSAAAAAGLEVGDQIEAVDGETVDSVAQLIELIGAKAPGDTVTLSVLRDDASQEISVALGTNPDDENKAYLGVLLGSFADMMRQRIPEGFHSGPPVDWMQNGAVIVEVVEDSAAAAAGLQPGDLIQAVDGETVDSVDALVTLIASKSPGDAVTLSILREGETLDVAVILGEHPDDATQPYLGVHLGAFFNLHMERPEDGTQTAPGEFLFHMRPGEGLNDFFNGQVPKHLQRDTSEFDA